VSTPHALRRNQASLYRQLERCLSTQTDGEVRIANKLRDMFPSAAWLTVRNILSWCLSDSSPSNTNHDIYEALKDEIQGLQGLRIFTGIPEQQTKSFNS
uniref:Uncharacterized protein n=1 Tax=Oryzias sinensis TaxID=183150 RepID=A0A8C7YG67_9TELE